MHPNPKQPLHVVLRVYNHSACLLLLFALQKEWLCLNCQTQRATSGQLGDAPPPAGVASPKKQPPAPVPAPSSAPAPAAVDSKPVVEAAEPTPRAPEAKVVPTPDTPTPALHTPEHPLPTPEPTPQETPDVSERAEPLAQPKSESEAPNSESKSQSSAEISVEQQLSSTEKAAPEQPEQPESEPVDTDQQTQGATAAEIPKVQQQIGCEEEVEKQTCSKAESSDVKQQEHSDSVANSPAGQQEESHSEKPLPAVESEPQNATTDTDSGPAKPEIEPKIEAVALPTGDVKVDPCPDKLPDQTENSIEPKQKLSPEMDSQELPAELDPKPDTAATMEKEQTAADVEVGGSNQNSQLEECKSPTVGETQQDLEDTAVTSKQVDAPAESDARDVPAPDVKGEVTVVKEVDSGEKVQEQKSIEGAVPPPADADGDKAATADGEVAGLQQEEVAKCEQSDSSSAVSEIHHPSSGPAKEIELNVGGEEPLSPPAAPAEKLLPVPQTEGTSVPEQTEQHATAEREIPIEKVPPAGEVAQQEIPQRAPDVGTSAEMKATTSAVEERDDKKKTAEEQETIEESAVKEAAAENESSNGNACDEDKAGSNGAVENAAEGLEADKEKALSKEATEEKTAVNASDQKPPREEEEEEVNRVESGPKPSTEAERFGHETEKKESEKTEELASAVAGAIPEDETQIRETVGEKAQSDITGEADRKEGVGQREEQQTSAGGTLRAGDECDKSPATSEEKVSGRQLAPSGQMASGVGAAEETCCPQETAPFPENGDEKKKETVADHSKREPEEQRETATGGDKKVHKEESQPVDSQIQTPVSSLAECNAVSAAAATDVQVDVSPESREGAGVSEAAGGNKSVSVIEIAVAEAELPLVPVASQQDKGPQEENTQSPQPADGGGGVDEVTVANSIVLSNHKIQTLHNKFHSIRIVSTLKIKQLLLLLNTYYASP